MLVGLLSLRNHRYHPNRRLLEAAEAMGHRAVLLHPARAFLSASPEGLRVVFPGEKIFPDVVLPRIGSTIREYPLTLLRHLEGMGVRLVNGSKAVACARNKFRTVQALVSRGVPVPDTRYASNERNLSAAAKDLGPGPCVVKTVQGRQGRGVFLAQDAEAVQRLHHSCAARVGEGLLLQAYVPPEARRREIRVLVIGGRAVSGMALRPRRGEFRANVHLRGRAERLRLTGDMKDVATKAATAVGLDIAGVDVIQKSNGALLVVDVNYSPGFKGLERCTGADIASQIIAFAVSPGRTGG